MYKRVFFILMSIWVMTTIHPAKGWAEMPTLDEARELYKAGKYEEAAPVFAKELKRKPNDGSLNHWYGVCLYETGEYEASIPYLKKLFHAAYCNRITIWDKPMPQLACSTML